MKRLFHLPRLALGTFPVHTIHESLSHLCKLADVFLYYSCLLKEAIDKRVCMLLVPTKPVFQHCHQGPVVQKPIKANPWLKVNRGFQLAR